MRRRQWFNWHSWAGFQLSLLLTFVLLTGTLATISHEIDWLLNPAMRADHGQPEQLDFGAIFDSAQTAFPTAQSLYITAPYAPWFNAEVTVRSASGDLFRVFVDPVTHKFAGTGQWQNWQRFFRQTHRHLMLPVNIGLTIVCLLVIPLSISLISSFQIYKRWWAGFATLPRKRIRYPDNNVLAARTFWGATHRLVGLWTLWFILLMILTSTWYFIEQWGGRASYPAVPSVEDSLAFPLTGRQLNGLIASAQETFPTLTIEQIRLPDDDAAVTLQGQANAVLVRPRANHVVLNSADGSTLDVRRGEDLSIHARIAEAADPLHFGTLGGWPTRILWFLFGAAMCALSISGAYLLGLRVFTRLPSRNASIVTPVWRTAWQTLNRPFRWPLTVLVILVVLAGLAAMVLDPQ